MRSDQVTYNLHQSSSAADKIPYSWICVVQWIDFQSALFMIWHHHQSVSISSIALIEYFLYHQYSRASMRLWLWTCRVESQTSLSLLFSHLVSAVGQRCCLSQIDPEQTWWYRDRLHPIFLVFVASDTLSAAIQFLQWSLVESLSSLVAFTYSLQSRFERASAVFLLHDLRTSSAEASLYVLTFAFSKPWRWALDLLEYIQEASLLEYLVLHTRPPRLKEWLVL